jgi:hypothetical protein
MNEQAVHEQQGRGLTIAEVAFYLALALVAVGLRSSLKASA